MKKSAVKWVLDALMALTLFLLYSKNAVSMSFHEIAGLAVCGAFLIHKALNWAWIKAVTRRLFDKTLPARTRIGWVVDALLLVCFAFIALSGVLISKTILTGISAGGAFWKTGHYFAAALSIVLIGVHIGLHLPLIAGAMKKHVRMPKTLARILTAALALAVLGYGGYQMAEGSFLQWLTAPFTTSAGGHGGTYGFSQADGSMHAGAPDGTGRGQGGSGKGLGRGQSTGSGQGSAGGAGSHAGGGTGTFSRAAATLASYASIAGVFTVLTAGIGFAASRRKRRADPAAPVPAAQ